MYTYSKTNSKATRTSIDFNSNQKDKYKPTHGLLLVLRVHIYDNPSAKSANSINAFNFEKLYRKQFWELSELTVHRIKLLT